MNYIKKFSTLVAETFEQIENSLGPAVEEQDGNSSNNVLREITNQSVVVDNLTVRDNVRQSRKNRLRKIKRQKLSEARRTRMNEESGNNLVIT